jgi:hypothetical protein
MNEREEDATMAGIPRVRAALALASLFIASTGCASTSIRRILDDPGRYNGREVTVSGEVTDSANLVVVRYYHVEDGTGRIAVVAKGAVPRRGANVTVHGTVRQAFAVGDQSLTVILENPR